MSERDGAQAGADAAAPPSPDNSVSIKLHAGRARFSATARLSSSGLLAVGGLVSSILLSTAVPAWVSTTPVRRHPILTKLAR